MITLHGIKNCDTVKRARDRLDAAGIAYRFHDFKTDGLSRELAQSWIDALGVDTVVNRKGTTWRKLDDATRDSLTAKNAAALLSREPSLVKRPVIAHPGGLIVGFAKTDEQAILDSVALIRMQDSLFGDDDGPAPPPPKSKTRGRGVEPADAAPVLQQLRNTLPTQLRLGTSSWSYPGWIGSVWAQEYTPQKLSKQGLRAYTQHPLLRTVSLDRAFYQALAVDQYAAYAAQVPDDFRFVVKAPARIADAMLRDENGHVLHNNPSFLDPELARLLFAEPALEGLGHKLGALVFQLSPLPDVAIRDIPAFLPRLGAMLRSLPSLKTLAPDAVIAVEVRNPEWLTPDFVATLREAGVTYCLGLHAKMPAIEDQLPILRALWPGPLVCRWNLHRKHGAFGYEDAKRKYGDFNQLVDPDPETRKVLARVIAGTTAAGYPAYVTLGNKAEGSAPLSAVALAEAVMDLRNAST